VNGSTRIKIKIEIPLGFRPKPRSLSLYFSKLIIIS